MIELINIVHSNFIQNTEMPERCNSQCIMFDVAKDVSLHHL